MRKISIKAILIAIILYYFVGCSNDNPTEPVQNNSVPLSKFTEIQIKVFTENCALSGCHGSANNQANLLLTEGNAYSNLVNVQSFLFPQFKRVVPDSSSKSLLIKILRGEVSPRMPLDRNPLPAEVIDSIAAWIDNGALNN